jgi:hypothetical protein
VPDAPHTAPVGSRDKIESVSPGTVAKNRLSAAIIAVVVGGVLILAVVGFASGFFGEAYRNLTGSQSGVTRTAPEILENVRAQKPGWCTGTTEHLNSLYQKSTSTWAAECETASGLSSSWECVLVNSRTLSLSLSRSFVRHDYC